MHAVQHNLITAAVTRLKAKAGMKPCYSHTHMVAHNYNDLQKQCKFTLLPGSAEQASKDWADCCKHSPVDMQRLALDHNACICEQLLLIHITHGGWVATRLKSSWSWSLTVTCLHIHCTVSTA